MGEDPQMAAHVNGSEALQLAEQRSRGVLERVSELLTGDGQHYLVQDSKGRQAPRRAQSQPFKAKRVAKVPKVVPACYPSIR